MSYNIDQFIENVNKFEIDAIDFYKRSKKHSNLTREVFIPTLSEKEEIIDESQSEIQSESSYIEWTQDMLDSHYTKNDKLGKFKAKAFTAKQTLPIEGAYVTVYKVQDGKTHIFNILRSDENGITDEIQLPTVSKDLSLTLENSNPYETYNVKVEYPGYLDMIAMNVPIFEGITSIQPFELIPSSTLKPNQKIPIVYDAEPRF